MPAETPTLTILCIRHAEKPSKGADGVNDDERPDPEALTLRGWQRSGAWVQVFMPAFGLKPALPVPVAIFASNPGSDDDASERPLETVKPLAAALGIKVDTAFAKGQEKDLAKALQDTTGTLLVCWQHENIRAIVSALDEPPENLPKKWPDPCFNMIYRLDRTSTGWSLEVLMPKLLDDDSEEPS